MASVIIELPEQQAAELTARAQAQGMTLEDWFRQMAEKPEPAAKSLDWSQCPAVESIPGKVSGAWVLKGTRKPVSVVFEDIEAGLSVEEVMEQFDVTREEVSAVLDFVTHSLDTPVVRTVDAHPV